MSKLEISGNQKQGSSLVVVLVFTSVCLIICLGLMGWAGANSRLTHRHIQYSRTTAAAEAATEKVFTSISADYRDNGAGYVLANMDKYRDLYPTASENPAWADFTFMDVAGNRNKTHVQYTPTTTFKLVNSKYAGLKAFANTFEVISNVREINTSLSGVAGAGAVQQQLEMCTIPLYQCASFWNLDFECNALPPITVSGPVHCNGTMYLTPVAALTFNNDVTVAGKILMTPKPGNPLPDLNGPITFKGAHDAGVPTISLPIGTNNSAAAVRQVIEIPPANESPTSTLGYQRFYNKADMIILVSNTNVVITSGVFNNFGTIVPWITATNFMRTNVSFTNGRENKTIRTTEIDIGKLAQFNTNSVLNPLSLLLPYKDIRTIFVADVRTTNSTTEPGIRLVNGQKLLPQGLTVASPQPVYIKGHYNCPTADLGTTNTSGTLPASVAADAITILSTAWLDANSASSLSSRVASNTTVNAALMAGIVQTSSAKGYSGGLENFTRFLEEWTDKTFTYNGSMVIMFDSRYATAPWTGVGGYYNPPIRNWTFDTNFTDPNKLPPATPTGATLSRSAWQVAQPGTSKVSFTY